MSSTENNKRKAEDAPERNGDAPKKSRWEPNGAADGSEAKPASNLSVLEKAKKAVAMQAQLKEKLAKLQAAKQAGAGPSGTGAPSKPATKLPPPLVVDEQGREIKPLAPPTTAPPASTAPTPPAVNPLLAPSTEEEDTVDDEFFDPNLGRRKGAGRRARPTLQFVEEGKFQKQAELGRLKATYGDKHIRDLEERRKKEAAMAADNVDANLVPLGPRAGAQAAEEKEEEIPDVEWWDTRLLVDKSSYGAATAEQVSIDPSAIRADRITNLVEHPVPLDPALEAPPPPPQPLRLTKKEMKKLRTQRRLAREQDKQDLIRQGLLEPPQPKVKISNLMRVLGADGASDPTAKEKEVQRQMAEREQAHIDRNLANKLTPAERREKKLKKLLDAEGSETHVGVFKIGDLSKPQLKFKVEVNAKENHMSGMAIVYDDFSLVVVEGGPKTLRRYQRLMLERIQWNNYQDDIEEEEQGGEHGAGAMDTDGGKKNKENYCKLVWSGVVAAPSFKRFRAHVVSSEGAARQLLEGVGALHYWDMVANFE